MATRAKGAGRKPTPSIMKALHGNPGKRAINKNEPQFSGAPVPSSWFSKGAREEWDRSIDIVQDLGLLKGTDQAVFAAYCVSYDRWVEAEKILNKEGLTVKEPQFNKEKVIVAYKIKPHPAVGIAQKAKLDMMKAAACLGFDPSSRTRVQVPTTKETPSENINDDLGLYEDDSAEITGGSIH